MDGAHCIVKSRRCDPKGSFAINFRSSRKALSQVPQSSLPTELWKPTPCFEALDSCIRTQGAFAIESSPDAEQSLGPFVGKPFVACVGRIEPNKNQLSLILAMRGTGTELVFIGAAHDPLYYSACKQWADDTVHFLGMQPRRVVQTALRHAQAHCLIGFGETPGLANLEALACGCPVVCGNRSLEIEYFGDLAHYADPLDLDSIRTHVLHAVAIGREGAERLQAMASVTVRFPWSRAAQETASAYSEATSGRDSS